MLDANILLRAVFGVRVRALLETYEEEVSFYSPDVCFDDARKYIPEIAKRRRIDPALGLSVLDQVSDIVQSVDRSLYEEYEKVARERVLPPIQTTGRSCQWLCCWIFQSGPKIRIFLAAASALGLPTESSCTFAPTEIRIRVVGAKGFEPSTSWSRTRRASQAALRPDI